MAGPVESAIRGRIASGVTLATPMQDAPFVVERIDADGMVLLLGEKRAWTRLSWECLEGIVPFLRGRGWVKIGSKYDTRAEAGTLDDYLKGSTCSGFSVGDNRKNTVPWASSAGAARVPTVTYTHGSRRSADAIRRTRKRGND